MNKKNKSNAAAKRNAEKAAKAAERRAADALNNAAEELESKAEDIAEDIREAAGDAVEAVQDKAEDIKEAAGDAVDAVQDKAEDIAEAVQDKAEKSVDEMSAAEYMASVSEKAKQNKQAAEKKVSSVTQKALSSSKKKKGSSAEAVYDPGVKVYNFCSKKRMILGIVIGVIAALLLGIIIRGVHLAIEFKGGTLLSYSYGGDIDDAKVQEIVKGVVPDTSVNVRKGESLSSGGKEMTVSFTAKDGLSVDKQHEITENLEAAFPNQNIVLTDSNDVSPSSGREFLLKCLIAVIFAAFVVVVYIAIRFRKIGGWSAGVCSVFALTHDILVALAATILFGFEFNSNIVAVILTILGYSINNTIVIYDRIRENRTLMPNASLNELINTGCSQSLTRSIRTSVTTIGTMLIVSIVVFVSGYNSLLSFSVPLMFGLISGTYSSLFVAPVTWSWWKSKAASKK
jgi:preprotein translocase subunit SecF